MKKNILLVAVLFWSRFCCAQNSPENLVTRFFQTFTTDHEKALDEMVRTNKWIAELNKEYVAAIKQEIGSWQEDSIGKYTGHESVLVKKISESFVLHICMVKFERQPIWLTFRFYKADKNWELQTLKVDYSFEDMIQVVVQTTL